MQGDGRYMRIEWPDPGGALEQSNLIILIFDMIKDELLKILIEEMKAHGRKT